MHFRTSPISFFALAAFVAVACGPLPCLMAQVATRSPFMPVAGPGSAAAPTAGATLEFRGYLQTSDGVQYRLYDPAKKAGSWVKLNERSAEFDVLAKQHDEGQRTLTIEHQGRTLTLAMRESKVVSGGSAAQMAPPPPIMPAAPPNVTPAVTQSVVLNPTPADEQRRLEAVASEVARRRAMREQATQQIGQGTPPPNLPPPNLLPQNPPGNPGGGRPPGQPTRQAR